MPAKRIRVLQRDQGLAGYDVADAPVIRREAYAQKPSWVVDSRGLNGDHNFSVAVMHTLAGGPDRLKAWPQPYEFRIKNGDKLRAASMSVTIGDGGAV